MIQNIHSERELESFYGSFSFAWKNKLYLELTGRQDWSSTLPVNNNAYFYPSASFSYVFSDDLIIPNLSFGKLRLAWAKVGSDGDPYSLYKTYVGNPNFGNYANYTVSNTLNKSDLTPEQTQSLEVGFDLRFFKDRAAIDMCFYTGKTLDQIIPLTSSATTGFTRQFINAGEISNIGFELVLHGIPIRKTNFSWGIDFQFGKNNNKVVSLVPEDQSIQSYP
ncbi:MAG: TonB-dependent receptor [Saprospiraceae bacterium]|nr:TonB-dependent receptor [Saprospiraceae bacterium]